MRWVLMGHELDRLDDPDGYLMLARSVARGDGLRINGLLTAYRPPLYPLALAFWVWASPGPRLASTLAGFHLGLGAITVALVADAARRWGLPRLLVAIAAAITAFDPVLVIQARVLMTETLAAALVAATLWGLTLGGKFGPIGGGLGFGLAALCRPSFLPAAGLSVLIGCLAAPGTWSVRVGRSSVLLLVILVVLAPWAIRNRLVLGEAVWTTTHGGYTLALANNPIYYADVLHGPPAAVWSGPRQIAWIDSINVATAGMTEPAADRHLRRQAIALARSRPADFVQASVARLGRFWGIMPASAVYSGALRWATAAWTIPFWLLVGVGTMDRRSFRWPVLVAPTLLVALTLVHAVYWTDLRMRAPLVPALALLAAIGSGKISTSRPRVAFLAHLYGNPGAVETIGPGSTKNRKIAIFLLGKIRRLD